MDKRELKKVFKFGNYSLTVLLPKNWTNAIGLEEGSIAELTFADDQIVIKKYKEDPEKIVKDIEADLELYKKNYPEVEIEFKVKKSKPPEQPSQSS